MIEKFIKHFNYYVSLVSIFIVGLAAAVIASPNFSLQIFIVILTIVIYVLWGILHHYITHELTAKIMVEYILIGLLGLSMIFFIFMGGRV
ncbi:MAG: hypothetical protein COU25_00865 [Candidatus Levybacteria bacterium CG10_big_fil_rev_8_21_14_0_10_35_13]|nr:MAG: hypothetical protein COU25_00865 [Candidatus Levybacteria bacterium CG10_big_fil_rev_8_21_14_0_10_35_13]